MPKHFRISRALACLLCALPLIASAQTYEFNRSVLGLRVAAQETPGSAQTSTTLVDFGSVATNTTEKRQVALTNTGSSGLRLTAAPSVQGNLGFGSNQTSCGATLAAGQSCIAEVLFSPSEVGPASGFLRFSTSTAGLPADVSLQGVAYNPVSLANSTPPSAILGTPYSLDFKQLLSVSNEGSPDYSLVDWTGNGTLPSGLSFNTGTGVLSGTPTASNSGTDYTVTSTYKNNRAVQVYSIKVGETKASFQGSNQALDFGTVEPGATPPVRYWSFLNSGNLPISLQLSGLPEGISVANGCTSVAPGALCDIVLSLQTQLARTIAQTSVSVSGATSLSQDFSVQGKVAVVTRHIELTSANPSLNFGWQATGSTAPVRSWAFKNTGNVPMTLAFSGVPDGLSYASTCNDVAPYESCNVQLSLNTSVERTIPKTTVVISGDWAEGLSQALTVEGGVAQSGFKKVTAPVAGLSFTALKFHQGLFYSVLYGTNPVLGTGSFLFTSADGKAWTSRGKIQTSAEPAAAIAISSSGRILVAGLSSGSTGGKVSVSDDGGQTWVVKQNTGGLGRGLAINDSGVAVFTTANIPQGFRSVNNGNTWANNAVNDNSSGAKIVTNGGAQFATMSGGALRYSLDSGVSWTDVFAGGGYLGDLKFANNRVWFSIRSTPGRVCSAVLGAAPSCTTVTGSPALTSIVEGNGVIVVGSSTANLAYKSTDGASWSPVTGLPAWPELEYGNGIFVGVAAADAYVAVAP